MSRGGACHRFEVADFGQVHKLEVDRVVEVAEKVEIVETCLHVDYVAERVSGLWDLWIVAGGSCIVAGIVLCLFYFV